MKERSDIFEERRNIIWEMLNKIEGITCCKPDGAFYLLPNIEGVVKKLGIDEVYRKLAEKNSEIRTQSCPSTIFMMFALYKH